MMASNSHGLRVERLLAALPPCDLSTGFRFLLTFASARRSSSCATSPPRPASSCTANGGRDFCGSPLNSWVSGTFSVTSVFVLVAVLLLFIFAAFSFALTLAASASRSVAAIFAAIDAMVSGDCIICAEAGRGSRELEETRRLALFGGEGGGFPGVDCIFDDTCDERDEVVFDLEGLIISTWSLLRL